MMEGMIKGKTYVGSSFILVQRGACSYNKDKSKKGKMEIKYIAQSKKQKRRRHATNSKMLRVCILMEEKRKTSLRRAF